MNPLKRLRKYQRAVAGALLPVLAFVWMGAAASPCVREARAAVRAASGGVSATASELSPSSSGMSASGMPVMADHLAHSPSRSPAPCPHCPPGDPHTDGSHVVCSTLSAFAAGDDAVSAPPYDSGQALPVPYAVADSVFPSPLRVRAAEPRSGPPPSVPLNLRHCIFLN